MFTCPEMPAALYDWHSCAQYRGRHQGVHDLLAGEIRYVTAQPSAEKTIRQTLKRYLPARCCTKRDESYRKLLSSLVSVTASLFFFGDIKVCCGHAVM